MRNSLFMFDFYPCLQRGVTLVEMMIAMVLGLMLVLVGTSLLVSSKSAYLAQADSVLVHETGRHALEVLTWSLRQAGYADLGNMNVALMPDDMPFASLAGLDAHSLKSTTPDIQMHLKKSVNGSDVLAIRFSGAGDGDQGDGTILNCAGFSIPSPVDAARAERGRSIFYVAEDAAGEPELRCKYKGKTSWSSVAIARGIESFQVLYGVDNDADGYANNFLSATDVQELDDALILDDVDAAARVKELNQKTHWKKIVAVKVALLVRGTARARSDDLSMQYDLFGKSYGETSGAVDQGVRVSEKSLPSKSRNRIRKIVGATILLRNQPSNGAT